MNEAKPKMNRLQFMLWLNLLLLILMSAFSANTLAEGGLSLSQTRVVFDSNMKNTKITISNQSDRVYLINSRALMPLSADKTQKVATQFIITPPLFRLEKESHNTLLIIPSDTSALPKDRESIFYLSFLAIPSVKKTELLEDEIPSTQLSLGINMSIKLFFRPVGLEISANIAPEKLIFSQHGQQLRIENPTPYYLTLGQLEINQKAINIRAQGAMLAPFSSQHYTVNEQAKQISWAVINDYGNLSERYRGTL